LTFGCKIIYIALSICPDKKANKSILIFEHFKFDIIFRKFFYLKLKL